MRKSKFQIGDSVVVAEATNQKYRPDLKVVIIEGITNTPKTIKYYLSDGTAVMSEKKLCLHSKED